jgi:diacylglycerol kinase family enzyme
MRLSRVREVGPVPHHLRSSRGPGWLHTAGMPIPPFDASTPLFIVFNAGSGSGDKLRNQQDMQKVLKDANRRHEFFVAEQPDQIGACATQAAQAAARNNGAVIVAGGDGTINTVAAATLPTGRPFGIVPQGTFNYSGRTHGIPLETIPATEALLDARVKPVQVGRVNDRIFLVNASLGLYPQLLEDRETAKDKLGRTRAVAFWAGLRTIASYRHQFVLEVAHAVRRQQPTAA